MPKMAPPGGTAFGLKKPGDLWPPGFPSCVLSEAAPALRC